MDYLEKKRNLSFSLPESTTEYMTKYSQLTMSQPSKNTYLNNFGIRLECNYR